MIGVRKIGCCYAVTVYGSNRTAFRSHKRIFLDTAGDHFVPRRQARLAVDSRGRPTGCAARLEL